MPDASYPQGGGGIYHKQGNNTLVVGSTGDISIEDGGKLEIPVTTQTTTSGTITDFGLTTFGTTIAGSYTLAGPTATGLRKILACTTHGATTVSQIVNTSSTSVTILSTSGGKNLTRMTFTNAGQRITLISASTTQWVEESNLNSVALSTV